MTPTQTLDFLREKDLSVIQAKILMAIHSLGTPLSTGNLAAAMDTTGTLISRQILGLSTRDPPLVITAERAEDRRKVDLTLTSEAIAICKRLK